MRERWERVESRGSYVTKSFARPFLLGPVFFRIALPFPGGYHLEGVGRRSIMRSG